MGKNGIKSLFIPSDSFKGFQSQRNEAHETKSGTFFHAFHDLFIEVEEEEEDA